VTPIETDLGEYILQLGGDVPSHIVGRRCTGRASGWRRCSTIASARRSTPTRGADAGGARRELRRAFLQADLGISGVNFACADTGTLVLVENEGNARLATSLPRVHVAVMGLEKLLPRLADLPTFLALLARSATGQAATSYVAPDRAPAAGEPEGPERFHVVILDGGRSACWPTRSCATRCAASAAAPASTTAPSTTGSAGTRTAGCTAARSAPSSTPACSASSAPTTCRTPRASAAPAATSARSRSPSPTCCSRTGGARADRDALVERFVERAAAAGAEVRRARDATAARELAAAWARELGDTAVAGDDGMARAVVAASGLPTVGVAEADVGITGAYRAIAETGTVVLRSESGRLAGLLPPVHLALVAEAAVVGGSSDVYRRLLGRAAGRPGAGHRSQPHRRHRDDAHHGRARPRSAGRDGVRRGVTATRAPGGNLPSGPFAWSGREDSNLRPHRPERCALPGCATPRRKDGV
jgi:L-lactate utilization protein LutC